MKQQLVCVEYEYVCAWKCRACAGAQESIIACRFAAIMCMCVCALSFCIKMSSVIHYTLFQTNLNVQSFTYFGAAAAKHGFSAKSFASRPIHLHSVVLRRNFLVQHLRQSGPKNCVVNIITCTLYAARSTKRRTCSDAVRSKQLQPNVIVLRQKTNWTIFPSYMTLFGTRRAYPQPHTVRESTMDADEDAAPLQTDKATTTSHTRNNNNDGRRAITNNDAEEKQILWTPCTKQCRVYRICAATLKMKIPFYVFNST